MWWWCTVGGWPGAAIGDDGDSDIVEWEFGIWDACGFGGAFEYGIGDRGTGLGGPAIGIWFVFGTEFGGGACIGDRFGYGIEFGIWELITADITIGRGGPAYDTRNKWIIKGIYNNL